MPAKYRRPSIRKHVTTACIPCRDGKVKCDGTTPTCRNCSSKGRLCKYRQSNDKRKVQVRVAVGLLARRVDTLARYIENSGLPVPKIEEHDYLVLKSIFEALELTCDDLDANPGRDDEIEMLDDAGGEREVLSLAESGTTDAQGTSAESSVKTNAESSVYKSKSMSSAISDGIFSSEDRNAASDKHHAPRGDLGQSPHPQDQDNGTDDESDDEVTDQLSCRLGRLQLTHDGQLRYFGSTSNLTLLDALVDVTPPISVTKDASELLESASLDREIDEIFEKHLLELFFAWQDPCLHVVDAETFWRSRAQSKYEGIATSYYSRTLVDAMCALGAAYEPRYHPEIVTFPRSLAEFFGDRAKILLELELESPSIATIQALVILSNHEALCTRDTRGWLYSGMAMRLTLDLGLHLDMTVYVQRGIIPYSDAELRRKVFWGVFLNEQFWGFYLGRSAQVRMDIVTVQRPPSQNTLPTMKWRPYPSAATMSLSPVPENMLFKAWVSLYETMLHLTDVLYGCIEISKHALQELAVDTVEKLTLWKATLPAELSIDEHSTQGFRQPLPHTLTLHMQYHQFMIQCHRPYISRHYIQPQPPQGPGPNHARRMCIESAVSIVKVLNIYEQAYGFHKANVQFISFIFSAALILIFTTVPTKSRPCNQELLAHLSTCFRALDEMGSCFENARRTSTFLGTLQRQWQTRRQHRKSKVNGYGASESRSMGWHANGTHGHFASDQNSLANQHITPTFDAGVDGLGPENEYSPIADPPSTVDFMDPDLCNILLSEGIPRAFI
ncbi:fungal-specific transcription factor [Aspergillus steynii IBT 23096]|uniref:Fungal-specific transcription factor n=1 Tax=Aspergillus steynii IBT 23096 TaxID=1392250 RepID=A0A2I2G3Y7_9EURO|nr:fungal-specific transcription factor [Aspergillus steynii IBT 23096]PLB47595.1 fungal-specific transcription factor [Aspergillus steynii IBT 23096]